MDFPQPPSPSLAPKRLSKELSALQRDLKAMGEGREPETNSRAPSEEGENSGALRSASASAKIGENNSNAPRTSLRLQQEREKKEKEEEEDSEVMVVEIPVEQHEDEDEEDEEEEEEEAEEEEDDGIRRSKRVAALPQKNYLSAPEFYQQSQQGKKNKNDEDDDEWDAGSEFDSDFERGKRFGGGGKRKFVIGKAHKTVARSQMGLKTNQWEVIMQRLQEDKENSLPSQGAAASLSADANALQSSSSLEEADAESDEEMDIQKEERGGKRGGYLVQGVPIKIRRTTTTKCVTWDLALGSAPLPDYSVGKPAVAAAAAAEIEDEDEEEEDEEDDKENAVGISNTFRGPSRVTDRSHLKRDGGKKEKENEAQEKGQVRRGLRERHTAPTRYSPSTFEKKEKEKKAQKQQEREKERAKALTSTSTQMARAPWREPEVPSSPGKVIAVETFDWGLSQSSSSSSQSSSSFGAGYLAVAV
uniref:Uncharacterized protein n=1 Tax=Chromera velia CCMP2878 TaxID=1169474 RepID=A0A0G4G416_9ALVE|eukprot:Cvel_20146.t1-p1 / transcript=Cvel_20146.t1 / gene=Cvel_20146 / organism=Chromera_velia_CCMP2878 / gene_product=hypothetical protein / transcript_product=hypothetical protein / location=Cvel_scaffold1788:3095-5344(-) / protein_length=473 / sequence_SO=supercontig / SO=protein_coding / is_pseudo=false